MFCQTWTRQLHSSARIMTGPKINIKLTWLGVQLTITRPTDPYKRVPRCKPWGSYCQVHYSWLHLNQCSSINRTFIPTTVSFGMAVSPLSFITKLNPLMSMAIPSGLIVLSALLAAAFHQESVSCKLNLWTTITIASAWNWLTPDEKFINVSSACHGTWHRCWHASGSCLSEANQPALHQTLSVKGNASIGNDHQFSW